MQNERKRKTTETKDITEIKETTELKIFQYIKVEGDTYWTTVGGIYT